MEPKMIAERDGPMQPQPMATVDHMDVLLTRLPGLSELPGRDAAASFACRRRYIFRALHYWCTSGVPQMFCGHNPMLLSHLWVGAAQAMRIAINARCVN
jgi:hypothetical protein